MVVVEIISYPVDRKPAIGKVTKILAKPEGPKAEIEAVLDEFNLPRRFPKNVHTEAASLVGPGPEVSGFRMQKRKDLRRLPTVTIDGERAKDFDDAVSIVLAKHGYTLSVHIADVGFYVGWDSAVDREARKRGTSVYFPDRVLPMLPKELSEDLCSLKPNVERLAFTVEMDFDRNGSRIGARFFPSVIVSDERMTYTSVSKILIGKDARERSKYNHLLRDFELMGELCGILRNQAAQKRQSRFRPPRT